MEGERERGRERGREREEGSAGEEVRIACLTCDIMSLLRRPQRVCPDPPAMTRKVAVQPDLASLREYRQM